MKNLRLILSSLVLGVILLGAAPVTAQPGPGGCYRRCDEVYRCHERCEHRRHHRRRECFERCQAEKAECTAQCRERRHHRHRRY